METQQLRWKNGWGDASIDADLVFLFGSPEGLKSPKATEIGALYPRAKVVGCSTAGEILGTVVTDDELVATAVKFAHTQVHSAAMAVAEGADSKLVGADLAKLLPAENLAHVLVFSDGLRVNGSSLVEGLRSGLPKNVQITGGLAGDGARFERTFVVDGDAIDHQVCVLGLYGNRIKVGYGSLGGWDSFGPMRKITKSSGNVLLELDGQPALRLYKEYLGDKAEELPSSGLLFPLSVQLPGSEGEVVRTILSVDESDQSLTFAGDVPEGASARLMKANFDRLVDGAHGAALATAQSGKNPELALLISCVGRKLVLKQRIEEEVEAVQDALGEQATLTGFYSYGEICPSSPNANCELHNQTMTITTFREE